MSNYVDPMTIQDVKAVLVWNEIKEANYPSINLNNINAVSISKGKINKFNVARIASKYPDVYNNMLNVLNT